MPETQDLTPRYSFSTETTDGTKYISVFDEKLTVAIEHIVIELDGKIERINF